MAQRYTLYAWPLSAYSGKTRAYLAYKGVPYVEREVRVWTMRTIARKVGAHVMPVVVTPQGEWLQDTSHIIDVLEQRHPAGPVVPTTPRQRIAACLLEAWGDEFWLAPAMHYRWSFPENFELVFQREGGDHLLPFAPRFIKNRLVAKPAGAMRKLLPGLGVVPGQLAAIEAWTEDMCDALEAHFAQLPYLLGTKPCIGDLGLIVALFAHLGRDPAPVRILMSKRPHLAAWIARMQHPQQPRGGAFLPDDRVPDTLAPVWRSVFGEFLPMLEATLQRTQARLPQLPAGRRLSRSLDPIEIPYGRARLTMAARPFSLWMAQRVLDAYRALDAAGRGIVDRWLAGVGGSAFLQLDIQPRLERVGLHVRPAA